MATSPRNPLAAKPVAYRGGGSRGTTIRSPKPPKPPLRPKAPARGATAGAVAGRSPVLNVTAKSIGMAAPSASGATTLQQLIQQITQPQIDFYTQQRADLTSRQAQQQQALQGFTQSILGYLSGIPSQVGATYDKAVHDTSALGNAAAAGLAAENPNGQAVATLNAIGAPQSQVDAITQKNADVFGGGAGVLNYVGGALPAETLAADRAANVAFAQELPGIQSMSAAQAFRQLLGSQSQQQSSIDEALAKIRSDATGQAYGIQHDLATQALAQQKYQASRADAAFNRQFKVASLKQSGQLAGARINQQGKIAADRSQQGWARLSQGDKRLAISQLQSDRTYGLAVARLGISQKGLALRTAQAQAKLEGGGFTAAQLRSLQAKAGKIADQAYNGVATKQNGVAGTLHLSYQEAMRKGLSSGIPLTVMQKALNSYWTKPGGFQSWETNQKTGKVNAGGGRPALSYQQRQASAGRGTPPFAVDSGGRPLSPAAKSVVQTAEEFMGTPYKWGGANPKTGFDCSGLLCYSFAKAGIQIPRTSQQQWHYGKPVTGPLQPGDAVFFVGSDGTRTSPGHVGIYIGNGEFVQSPHTGDVIKVSKLDGYPGYVGARRFT